MKNFNLYWPILVNMHLTKDVGTIPFLMNKYYNYNSKIYTVKTTEEYEDSKKYLNNLPIEFVSTTNDLVEMIKDSDILMLIGLYSFNYAIIDIFKKINPRGKIYLKLDMNIYWFINALKDTVALNYLKRCDLVTCETKSLCELIEYKWNVATEYIPNGYYNFSGVNDELIEFDKKENTILIVGRVGAPEKCHDIILNAFKMCESFIPSWNLTFVGPISDDFKPFIDNFMSENDFLKDRINFVGPIYDKAIIADYYKRSKIFCLTSKSEGFPLVFPEASHYGCYIISTFLDPACDITNNQEYGSIIPKNSFIDLSSELVRVCNDPERLRYVCDNIQLYSRETFDWVNICQKLDSLINKL